MVVQPNPHENVPGGADGWATEMAESHRLSAVKPRHEQLELAAVAGDRAALAELLVWHFDGLQEFVERHRPAALQGVLETEDLVQETYVRAIRGIATFNPAKKGTFRSWLLAIAHHTMQSLAGAATARKRGGQYQQKRFGRMSQTSSRTCGLSGLMAQDGTGSGVAATREALLALEAQIVGLPEEHRQAVRLSLLQGCSLEETATVLGRSPAAVRGLLHRAKQRLREALGRSSRWFGR